MPVDERKLLKEIKDAGCSVEQTKKGHFLVLDSGGNPIESYAVRHPGKREVLDAYVKNIRKALSKIKQQKRKP